MGARPDRMAQGCATIVVRMLGSDTSDGANSSAVCLGHAKVFISMKGLEGSKEGGKWGIESRQLEAWRIKG